MSGGLFITLYDDRTLALYLNKGIYGFLMPPLYGNPSPQSNHYAALADYACARQGTHIFFFLKRKIVYGGTVNGNNSYGSFYINGQNSPLGLRSNASLFWDESERYSKMEQNGVFRVGENSRCQPFVLLFEPNALSKREISSDDLYFELGKYPYPLPSNSIQGMSFCTLTPGETATALDLFNKSRKSFNMQSNEILEIKPDKIIFDKAFGIDSFNEPENIVSESHLEFSLLANPDLMPRIIRPNSQMVLCRQVPISPFKPSQMDRADICIYDTRNPINDGTIPNILIELKHQRANFHAYNQVSRYLRWLDKVISKDQFEKVSAYLLAPDFYINPQKIDRYYSSKISLIRLDGNNYHI